MAKPAKYICTCCGKEHTGWPALAYNAPMYYAELSEEDKQKIAVLSSDFCIINHPDQTDRFIRCTLTQKVIDYCQTLEYGIWTSLSEKSYQDYADNYNNQNHEATYFGWIANQLPGYTYNGGIPASVFTRKNGARPEIVPHNSFDHPFVHDYYNGITKAEAERRIQGMLDNLPGSKKAKKPWWKL